MVGTLGAQSSSAWVTDRALARSADLLIQLQPGIQRRGLGNSWVSLLGVLIQRVSQRRRLDRSILPSLHDRLGVLLWQAEDYESALKNFESARLLARAGKLLHLEASAWLGICLVHWAKGNPKEASKIIKPVYNTFARRDRRDSIEIRLLAALGLISFSRGHYSTAEKHFRNALGVGNFDDKTIRAQLCVGRGLCLQMLGRLPAALRQYGLAAHSLANDQGARREFAHIDLLRSSAFFQAGDLANAQAALERATRQVPFQGEIAARAFFESGMGRIYMQTGKSKKAASLFKSAAKLWRRTGKPSMALNASGLIASTGRPDVRGLDLV